VGIEAFRYDDKRALVIGGATGMGAAAAQIVKDLGATVVVMDYAEVGYPVDQAVQVDLRDRVATDAATDEVAGPVHAVFACAGVADGTPGIMKVNFISQQHVIEKLIDDGKVPKGAAIAMISSVAGLGWENNVEDLKAFIDLADYDAQAKWIDEHPENDGYGFSKQCILTYVAYRAYPFMKQGIRINAIQPGPTDTPLARANADVWLGFASDYRGDVGIEASTPEEQAYPMAFLCSDAASHVSGISFVTDAGYVSAGFTGAYDAPFIKMMMGRG
jgi:NAD(P)-dependent dehydrogenase (short-subunit alcohol dehydrogenase family)